MRGCVPPDWNWKRPAIADNRVTGNLSFPIMWPAARLRSARIVSLGPEQTQLGTACSAECAVDSSGAPASIPDLRHASVNIELICSANTPSPLILEPKFGSLSLPPRISRMRFSTFFFRSGKCSSNQSLEQLSNSVRQAHHHISGMAGAGVWQQPE